MNHNDVIYTQTDSALNRFFCKIYGFGRSWNWVISFAIVFDAICVY